jgi:hypothetical protein
VEYIPLALAIIVLLKVEATLYDGERSDKVYRSKLAEHRDRDACSKCLVEIEPVYCEIRDDREASAAADGDLREPAPRKGTKAIR